MYSKTVNILNLVEQKGRRMGQLVQTARKFPAGLVLLGSMLFFGCSSGAPSTTGQVTLRLGYFPNLTHAPAMVGLESGLVAKALGANVTIDPKVFNAGPDEVEFKPSPTGTRVRMVLYASTAGLPRPS